MEKKRIAWLDIAKAIGMMIVLFNHAELDLGVFTYLGGMFYMPVFFILAGMTLSYHKEEKFRSFAAKKAKRLLLPYLLYNLFLFLFFFGKDSVLTGQVTGASFFPLVGILYSRNSLFAGEETSNIYFMQNLNAPTWYLTCLFLTLMFAWWMMHWAKDDEKKMGIINGVFFILASILHYLCPVLLPWSLDTALYAVSFVLLGKFLQRKNIVGWIYQRPVSIIGGLIVFIGISYYNGSVNMSVGSYGKSMILYFAAGALGSVLCMELAYFIEKRSRTLTAIGIAIGKKTIRILCLHLFVFMLVRVGAGQLGYLEHADLFVKLWMIILSLLILVPAKWENRIKLALVLLIMTWFLPFINKGLDVQDTCFYLINYRYAFDHSVPVNELYYLFAEALGGIIYHMCTGFELLGLNLACAAIYTGIGGLIYWKLRNRMPKILLLLSILSGSFFAITWVHCVNWNAWSVLFLTIGAWILLSGLEKDNWKMIGFSGFLLGINAFVRMPNILFLSLVVVIFWKYLMEELIRTGRWTRQTVWTGVRPCFPFVAGAAIEGIIGMLCSIGLLGIHKFIKDLMVVTCLGSEGDLHSVTTGIYQFLVGLRDGAVLWIRYGFILIVCGVILMLLKKIFTRILGKEQAETCVMAAGCCTAVAFGLIKGYREELLDVQVFVAFGGILLLGIAAVYYRKKDLAFSCLCLTAMIIEGFLTIGTDTATIYYRIYMMLPIAMILCILCRCCRNRKEWYLVPAFVIAYVLASGYGYATTYIYHDAPVEELTATVENPIFTGIYTTPERAECLERLESQLQPYSDYEVITIGNFNAAMVVTDMRPFFENSWPDLDYLTEELFHETLETKLAQGSWPVVIIATEEVNGAYWMPEKVEELEELVAEEPYQCIYQDSLYSLYVPDSGEKQVSDQVQE